MMKTRCRPGHVILLCSCVFAASCDDAATATRNGAASPSSSASTSAVAATAATPPPTAPPPPPCRVTRVSGSVYWSRGRSVDAKAAVQGNRWITLAKDGRATIKRTLSGREWTLVGPGLMRPCYQGEETILVSVGSVELVAGAGVRPGAAARVASPAGVVHWGDARGLLTATDQGFSVKVESGSVELWTVAGAKLTGASRLVAGQQANVVAKTVDPLAECRTAAGEAARLARELLSRAGAPAPVPAPSTSAAATPSAAPASSAESLGAQARRQAEARKLARRACASAAALAAPVSADAGGRKISGQLAVTPKEVAILERSWRQVSSGKSDNSE